VNVGGVIIRDVADDKPLGIHLEAVEVKTDSTCGRFIGNDFKSQKPNKSASSDELTKNLETSNHSSETDFRKAKGILAINGVVREPNIIRVAKLQYHLRVINKSVNDITSANVNLNKTNCDKADIGSINQTKTGTRANKVPPMINR